MARRQFGSIEKLSSGRYRARYRDPQHPEQWVKAPRTYASKDDAAGWLRAEERLIEFDDWTHPEERLKKEQAHATTVGEWLTQWLDLGGWAASTEQNYRRTVEARILEVPGLRDVPLAELTRKDVIRWWDGLTEEFGAQSYNFSAYRRLSTALSAAVDRDLIDANPAAGIKAIKRPVPHRKELPTAEVMHEVIAELPERYRVIGALTLFHGLRLGEALGLKTSNVTVTEVKVRGTAWRKVGEGMHYKSTPKTDAGNRTVPVFPRFRELMATHLEKFAGDEFLTTTTTGELVMDTSYRSILGRAKKAAGHEHTELTSHYGRVWLITTLAEEGMSPVAIGELLGQTDLRTITEIYMRATEKTTAEILGRIKL